MDLQFRYQKWCHGGSGLVTLIYKGREYDGIFVTPENKTWKLRIGLSNTCHEPHHNAMQPTAS